MTAYDELPRYEVDLEPQDEVDAREDACEFCDEPATEAAHRPGIRRNPDGTVSSTSIEIPLCDDHWYEHLQDLRDEAENRRYDEWRDR